MRDGRRDAWNLRRLAVSVFAKLSSSGLEVTSMVCHGVETEF
jgi:hypothetical protein